MQMTGQHRIEASRQVVWQALNEPETLKRCIPGCEDLERLSDTEFAAKVKIKVGPVAAVFSGRVTLSDLDPPKSYRISGAGKGGAAGFAKGDAKIRLEEDGGATLLSYEVEAQVGGKLAQIGSRLIDGTARKLADEFFTCFVREVGPSVVEEPGSEEQETERGPEAAKLGPARSTTIVIGGLALIAVLILLLYSFN